MCRRGGQGLIWGARGPFPLAAAMVVAVVMVVVFVLRLLKNAVKTLILVFCKQCLYLLLYIISICNSRNANCSKAGAQTTLVQ